MDAGRVGKWAGSRCAHARRVNVSLRQYGDSVNLYLHRRLGKRRNLQKPVRGEIAREHFAARLPDFFALP